VAQGTAIVGFDFALPFMPLYLQHDLGIHGLGQIALWAGIVGFGPAIPATILAPIWGRMADRFGYRVMLLRAMVSAAALLALMGFAQSVWVLVALRMVQGGLTGTIYSAQALVASAAPEDETGRAMGLLQMSVYGGATVGPVAGGLVAQLAGYRASFVMAGLLLLVATAIVFVLVVEPVRSPRAEQSHASQQPRRSIVNVLRYPPFAAALAFTVISQVASSAQFPILPLFVQHLLNGHGGVTADTGWLLALSGLAAAVGSYCAGKLYKRRGLTSMLRLLGGGCTILVALQSLAPTYVAFLGLRVGAAFAFGGMFALLGVWAAASSPKDAKGTAFGLVGAAGSFGFGAGPLLGGLVVSLSGLRAVFVLAAALLLAAWFSTFVRAGSPVGNRRSSARAAVAPEASPAK
jgi:DHA1 family multidrug resistance protein-like MFS transporter